MSRDPRLAYPSPNVRKRKLFSAMGLLGNPAMSTLISRTMVQSRMACRYAGTSNSPSGVRKAPRFRDARLHAVSSRNMYSLHGLEALMRPSSGHVCHSLIVVSYCIPGSAHIQAAQQMRSHRSLALSVLATAPSVRRVRCHSPFSRNARKNPLGTRMLLLEFCPDTV